MSPTPKTHDPPECDPRYAPDTDQRDDTRPLSSRNHTPLPRSALIEVLVQGSRRSQLPEPRHPTPAGPIHLRESDHPETILTTTPTALAALIRTLTANSHVRMT